MGLWGGTGLNLIFCVELYEVRMMMCSLLWLKRHSSPFRWPLVCGIAEPYTGCIVLLMVGNYIIGYELSRFQARAVSQCPGSGCWCLWVMTFLNWTCHLLLCTQQPWGYSYRGQSSSYNTVFARGVVANLIYSFPHIWLSRPHRVWRLHGLNKRALISLMSTTFT